MKIEKKRYDSFVCGLCWAIILCYVCAFCFINLAVTPQFYCTDMYEDVILSVEMWKGKTIFPSNWVFGNQVYVVATPVLAAFVYGLTGNALLSMGIASSIMAILVLLSFEWMLRTVFSRLRDRLVAVIVLITMIAFFGDAVEFVNGWQLLFTLCTFYACYAITTFLAFGCYLRKESPRSMVALTALLCFATGIQSLRQTAITILPMIAMELLCIFWRAYKKEKLVTEAFWLTLVFTVANLLGVVAGKSIPVAQQHIYGTVNFASIREYLTRFYENLKLISVLVAIKRFKYSTWKMPILLVGVVFGAVCVWRYRKEKEAALLYLMILSLLAILGIGTITKMEMREIYYFMIYPLAACMITLLVSKSSPKMESALLGAVIVAFPVCWHIDVMPSFEQIHDREQDISYQVYEDLRDSGIATMYSSWNRCEKVAIAGNLEINAGFWDREDEPFNPIPYLCKTDTFNATPEKVAYLFYSPEEVDLAIEKAQQAGVTMTLLYEYPEHGMYVYTAPINLMEYYLTFPSNE